MKGFFSPIDKLAAELPRTKGTGAEFMTELSKRPGYRPQEAQDRDLQALMAMPKMAREEFLAQLKAKPAPKLQDTVLDNAGAPTQYDKWTLPGGTNYREILMRMPPDEQRAKEFSDPASGHWDTPDVLAHVRAKDRTGPNGEKLLHIEEIQSDWHQKGREHGYATPESLKEFRAVELRHKLLKQKLDEAKAQSESAENSLKRKEPLFQQPDVRERYEAARVKANNDLMDLMPQVMKAQAEVQDFGHKMNSMVPNAPFKKNWHELALKKMIHHAAEQGYHGIVITPGEEQANRYDLSKHVGMVSYHPEQQRFQAFKPNRETLINETGATPERVAELIGKDAAARLMDAPQNMGHHYLEGENLRVGGEGMKGFYDKIVPSFLNQFGKKYGAKVGTMHTPINRMTEDEVIAQFPGGVHDAMRAGDVGAEQYVAKKLAEHNKPMPLHHFPITPEMREDVTKNGVPLYAEGGNVSREASEANKAKFLKGSKAPERVYHGTGNLESLQAFDPAMTGKGTDQLGSGFYFSNKPDTASGYAPAVTGGNSPGMVAAHLAIRKPIKIGPKGNNLNDSNVKLTHDQVKRIMAHAPNLYDTNESPLANHFDLSKGVNPKMIHDVAQYYTGPQTLHMLENDMFPHHPTEYRHALHKVLGYDGVVKDFGNGEKHYVAWFPHQVKSAIGNRGTYDPNEADIAKATGGSIKPVGYTKEKVTVSPSLDQMRYELISVKHSKKVK